MRYLDVKGSYKKNNHPENLKMNPVWRRYLTKFVATLPIAFVPCAEMGHRLVSSNYVPVSFCVHHFWRDHFGHLERLSGRGFPVGPPLSSKPPRSALGRAHENRCRRGRRWAQSYPRAVGGAGPAGHGTATGGGKMISTMADSGKNLGMIWYVWWWKFDGNWSGKLFWGIFLCFCLGGETLFWTKKHGHWDW